MEFNYCNIIKEKNKKIRNILNICDRKDKEIERLNNIINELEQYLIDVGVDDDILKCCGRYDVNGVEIRKYIKELKGENSNEN